MAEHVGEHGSSSSRQRLLCGGERVENLLSMVGHGRCSRPAIGGRPRLAAKGWVAPFAGEGLVHLGCHAAEGHQRRHQRVAEMLRAAGGEHAEQQIPKALRPADLIMDHRNNGRLAPWGVPFQRSPQPRRVPPQGVGGEEAADFHLRLDAWPNLPQQFEDRACRIAVANCDQRVGGVGRER